MTKCVRHIRGRGEAAKPILATAPPADRQAKQRGVQIAEGNGTKIKHTTHKPLFQTVLQNPFSLLCYKEHDSFVPLQHK